MIGNITFGIGTTNTRTRIDTFAANACAITSAVGVDNTFRLTTFVRVTEIVIQTCANATVALGVGATWRWLTLVSGSFSCVKNKFLI